MSPLGPSRSPCLNVYGRVDMWDAQDVFYACKSRTERVHDCVVQGHAALLCVNIGVCACVFHSVTEENIYSVWKLQPVCSCQCSWLAFMQRFCPLSA